MEKLINCDIVIDIELIEMISGANQYFEVTFLRNDNAKYKLIFDYVWDMRYSIENTSINRFCQFRENIPSEITDNSIYMVENSEYIKYFENQVSGTRPMYELRHYILHDNVDTVMDVLTVKTPLLVQLP